MLTNEMINRIHENAVAHGFWEPGEEPTFGEYCALIHEEISEAFSAWRNGEPDEYVKDGKPEGVWVELADVVIRIGDMIGTMGGVIKEEKEEYKRFYNDVRSVIIDEPEVSFARFAATLHNLVSCADMDENSEIAGLKLISAAITIFVRAEHNHIDLDAIIERKCVYNATRPYKHGKRM